MQYIPRDGAASPTAGKQTSTLLRIDDAVKLSHQSSRTSCRGVEYLPVDGIVSGRANLWRRVKNQYRLTRGGALRYTHHTT